MATEFGQKCEHDIIIQKKIIMWTGHLNVLYSVYMELRNVWNLLDNG
jgi:hypothetical protein